MSTLTALRHMLLDDWPWLGWYATADSVGSTYIEDRSMFEHERLPPNEMSERFLYRYNRTGHDRVRETTTVDVDLYRLSVDGGVYANTNDTDYEFLGLHPDEINHGFVEAMRSLTDRQYWPISLGKDGNMELSHVQYWDGTLGSSALSNATVSKVTDEEFNYQGPQSLKVTVSSAGGYCRTQRYRTVPGKRVTFGVIAREDASGMTLRAYNATTGLLISGATTTYVGEDFVAMFIHFTAPQTCYELQFDFVGAAAGALYVANVIGPYRAGMRQFELPSYLGEQYSIRGIRTADYRAPISGSNQFDAFSRVWTGELLNGDDFVIESFHRSVNPYHVSFNEPFDDAWFERGLWVIGERPLSDAEPLDDETDTTTRPDAEVLAAAKYEVARIIRDRNPNDPQWDELVRDHRIEAAIEKLSRPAMARIQKQGTRKIRA